MSHSASSTFATGAVDEGVETVGALLARAARRSPHATALRDPAHAPGPGGTWTYAQLNEAALACAVRLGRLCRPGERIAVWSDNRPEWVVLQFGAALAGLVLVTVNPAYKKSEAGYVLRQSRAAACFAARDYRGVPLLEFALAVQSEVGSLRAVEDLVEWVAVAARAVTTAAEAETLPVVDPCAPAMIQYTSGTTGSPKGALLPHASLTSNAVRSNERTGLPRHSVWLATTPLFHVAGSVVAILGSVATDSTIVLMRHWSTDDAFDLIESERVTVTNLVPTQLRDLTDHEAFEMRDLSSLRTLITGAAIVPAALVRKVEEQTRARVHVMFGQTECAGCVTMTHRADDERDREETIGTPLLGTEIRIVDAVTGATAPPHAVGELLVRGGTMIEYFDDPDATAATLAGDGWLRTGDLCSRDERGYVRVVGRLKDMIIRGGENIYPREIEERLLEERAISDVAIVGIAHDRWGEIAVAVIVPAAGEPPVGADLARGLRSEIAGYKVPSRWYSAEVLPRTPTGKIQKFRLQEMIQAGVLAEL